MTWIKICGTTNLDDARAAAEAGADAVGFVFAESPRQVAPEAAAKIARALPAGVERIGVFVQHPPAQVRALVEEAGLTGIQLHGDEGDLSEEQELLPWAGERGLRVILAVSALEDTGAGLKRLRSGAHRPAMLLDSMTPSLRGGTGVTWDWRQFAPFVDAIRASVDVVVAGGLKPENVQEAIRVLHPWGVDVVSGVEREPGKKDHDRVRAFVKAVREAETTRR